MNGILLCPFRLFPGKPFRRGAKQDESWWLKSLVQAGHTLFTNAERFQKVIRLTGLNREFAGRAAMPGCGQTLIDPAATSETKLFYRAMRMP